MHYLKNPKSQRRKKIEDLAIHTKLRVGLTGTPIQNAFEELGSLLNFLAPGKVPGALLQDLATTFRLAKVANASSSIVEDADAKLSAWKELIRKYVLQRGQTVLAQALPPCTREMLFLDPTPKEAAAYAKLVKHSGPAHGLEATSKLTELLGAADGAKHRFLQLWLQTGARDGCKSVVVSSRTSVLDVVEEFCSKEGWRTRRLDGTMTAHARSRAVEDFVSQAWFRLRGFWCSNPSSTQRGMRLGHT